MNDINFKLITDSSDSTIITTIIEYNKKFVFVKNEFNYKRVILIEIRIISIL